RDQLAARRDDEPLQLPEKAARIAVGRDDDVRRVDLGERANTASLSDLYAGVCSEDGEPAHDARRLDDPVPRMQDRAGEVTRHPRLELVDPLDLEAVREQRVVLGSQRVALLVV